MTAATALNPQGPQRSEGPEGQTILERERPRGSRMAAGKKVWREGFGAVAAVIGPQGKLEEQASREHTKEKI
jgi:hypothetical protein